MNLSFWHESLRGEVSEDDVDSGNSVSRNKSCFIPPPVLHSSAWCLRPQMFLHKMLKSQKNAVVRAEISSPVSWCGGVKWHGVLLPAPEQGLHSHTVHLLAPQYVRGSTWCGIGSHGNEGLFSSLRRKGLDDPENDMWQMNIWNFFPFIWLLV